MTLQEQLKAAIELVATMFDGPRDAIPEHPPKDLKRDEIWTLYREAQTELNRLRSKRGDRPKVQDAVKMVLEDDRLTAVPIPLVAEIVQTVFKQHGVECSCSPASVRWYVSQNTLKWDIKPRRRGEVL